MAVCLHSRPHAYVERTRITLGGRLFSKLLSRDRLEAEGFGGVLPQLDVLGAPPPLPLAQQVPLHGGRAALALRVVGPHGGGQGGGPVAHALAVLPHEGLTQGAPEELAVETPALEVLDDEVLLAGQGRRVPEGGGGR